MPFEFPPHQRIKKEVDFRNLIKNAARLKNGFFFYFLKNDYSFHRFAVSVNRKIGNAVQRNYIKRKMKELFRLNQCLPAGGTKYDLWVVIKKRFTAQEAGEIEKLFINSLKRIVSR